MEKQIEIKYTFIIKEKDEMIFDIKLDGESLNLIRGCTAANDWTKIDFCRCPHCSYNSPDGYCPVAANLSCLIERIKDFVSYDDIFVKVETEDREYRRKTKVHQAVSSLVGIYMTANDCPVMNKMKPMLRYHLPFASLEETTYRAISMYLMSQYFLFRKGRTPELDLKNLVKIYDDIQIVNRSFALRTSELKIKDANIAAISILNSFANYVSFSINEDMLEEWEILFKPYFDKE